ncbi:transposase [Streptomyces sp. Rer75]|uniref:IS701 family transposase n=1 Tax=Streptomyces sp. Rer75 TaxID=2750011 RepID=UPI0015D089B4|nr:transposase [Streptomyces sp. Rer75]QLH21583.1 transposase [Streptomyces sp. Rer75]
MAGHDELLADLGSTLFASLPRSDQRGMALTYVRGLLTTRGRKSFRNMAASLGVPRLEQRLHHFISCSTWDWAPLARAAAGTVMPMAPPEGWVLRTLVTPRTGESTVGVHKRFCPGYGQVLNAQYAVGLWAASTTMCYPLAWRLLLPPEWFRDEARRARASIPGNCTPETPVVCGLSAYLDLPDALRGRLPIVMDMRGVDIPAAVHQLRAVRVPFLVKAYRGLPMTVVDPALPHVAGPQWTYQIMAAAEEAAGKAVPTGGPVWGPGNQDAARGLVAAVRVRLPFHRDGASGSDGHGDPYDLLLLRTCWEDGQRPDEVWLTNMLDTDATALLSLTALPHRVDDAIEYITAPLGIRDFTGRSYGGWNRHATLTSVAHAIALLMSEVDGKRPGP